MCLKATGSLRLLWLLPWRLLLCRLLLPWLLLPWLLLPHVPPTSTVAAQKEDAQRSSTREAGWRSNFLAPTNKSMEIFAYLNHLFTTDGTKLEFQVGLCYMLL